MVTQAKRRGNDAYNAKCDRIELRPQKPIGADIRAAVALSGQSAQSYILQAIRQRMERDGFTPQAEWPTDNP